MVDQRPIEGNTNEIGALPAFLQGLFEAYKRTKLFDVIVADAGNSSKYVMQTIVDAGYDFFLRIKMNAGDLFEEVQRQLAPAGAAECEVTCRERGALVTYRLWRVTLNGWMSWRNVRQVIVIERVVAKNGTEPVVGTRFFGTSLKSDRFRKPELWLQLARLYWRCENEQHWTSDVFFGEDRPRTPWTTDAEAIYVAAFFRVIALNVLAVLRAGSRREHDRQRPLPWAEVHRRVTCALRAFHNDRAPIANELRGYAPS